MVKKINSKLNFSAIKKEYIELKYKVYLFKYKIEGFQIEFFQYLPLIYNFRVYPWFYEFY